MKKDALFVIGKIVGTHGLKGHLKTIFYADTVEDFKQVKKITFNKNIKPEIWYEISGIVYHKKNFLLSLKDINDISLAETFIGKDIFIKRQDLPPLEKGTYYWQDLIGFNIFDKNKGYIGSIENIINTSANDVFIVKKNDKEILVPVIPSVILSVEEEKEIIEIDLPEGL